MLVGLVRSILFLRSVSHHAVDRLPALMAKPKHQTELALIHPDEVPEYLADLLFERAAKPRQSVKGIESVLALFGLDGTVEQQVECDLREFMHVRHLLVHRDGRCDRAFRMACPTVAGPVGSQLAISMKMWNRYKQASHAYLTEIVRRIMKAAGAHSTKYFTLLTPEEFAQFHEATLAAGATHLNAWKT